MPCIYASYYSYLHPIFLGFAKGQDSLKKCVQSPPYRITVNRFTTPAFMSPEDFLDMGSNEKLNTAGCRDAQGAAAPHVLLKSCLCTARLHLSQCRMPGASN